jgi:radical SAM superfamily enzyme YgiQ (UPF0313 family)
MKVMLVSMPIGDMTQPYTSLPSLTAHLRPAGFDVVQRDYGVDFAHYWSDPSRFPTLMDVLARDIREQESGTLQLDAWEDYVDAKVLESQLQPYAQCLDRTFAELKDEEILGDLWRLAHRLQLLAAYQHVLALVERREFPNRSPFQALSRADGLAFIQNPPQLYRRFIEERVVPDVTAETPDVLGISITYPRQFFPSLVLCAAIRRVLPRTKLVLGGAYFSTVAETLYENPELQRWWDYAVVGEGETALRRLLDVLGGAGDLEDVPNLIFQRNGMVHRPERRFEEDIHALQTPDFRGLNLDAYLAPRTVFLLPVARGCYMRCTFCSISYATMGYRCRTGETVVQDIRNVQEQVGAVTARSFNFSIDVMAPKHLREMALAISEAKLGITWDAEIRLDRTLTSEIIHLMREAGCQHLRFGLESAVDRIRELMDKRIQIDRVREILADCRREGIKASTMLIVGFPGETEAEAEQTFRFVYDNNDLIRFFALNVYTVSRGSIIASNPELFGITLSPMGKRLVQPSWDFTVDEGIPTNRARELATEFRHRLLERYPLADEGFSVGIGGAFTFLVCERWSWEELLRIDAQALGTEGDQSVGPDSVIRLHPHAHVFTSPYQYDGEGVSQSTVPTTYIAITHRQRLLSLDPVAACAIAHLDGMRTVAELSKLVEADGREVTTAGLCHFFDRLREAQGVTTGILMRPMAPERAARSGGPFARQAATTPASPVAV